MDDAAMLARCAWIALTATFTCCAAGPPNPLPPAAKSLPMPGETFLLRDHAAFLMLPPVRPSAAPIPWVLCAPTLPGLPDAAQTWMFERFLAAGIAIAGIDVGESYGSPAGCVLYDVLHEHLVHQRGLAAKPVLLARSRGGLMALAWAADRADRVAAFAGIYPVFDLRSYPGLAKAAGAHGTTEAGLAAMLASRNPIERVDALADARVPFYLVHGDHDDVVPLAANSAALAERVRARGDAVELEILPGRGHDMDLGFFRSEALVAFVLRHAR